ncbi:unnamed protein product [Schistocephalus solidus]|uniref:FBD domain-containing protein n=1 Tax=Schistocephalus solidus TaxID=70667 RepID=A0A183SHQ1_SCHSO|nr:unnamed protein product [Schistocephalus solidus]
MFKNLTHLPFEVRLAEIGLLPLNSRRKRVDLIQTYRIARGPDFTLEFDGFIKLAEKEHLRVHPFKLQRKLVHMEVQWNAFSWRNFGAWNGHPDEVILSETVEIVKC